MIQQEEQLLVSKHKRLQVDSCCRTWQVQVACHMGMPGLQQGIECVREIARM